MGGYYNPSGTNNIKFVRDPEKLLAQYSNLIKATAKKYNKYWASEADRKDLYSYIIDTFLSLVYEYDINSEVDFRGYIKRMLDIRVAKSYSIPEKEKRDHIFTLNSRRTSIEDLISAQQLSGKVMNTTWFNSKKSKSKVTEIDGSSHGVDSRIANMTIDDSLDTSMLELMDILARDDRLDYVQMQMIKYISISPNQISEVLDYLGHKFHYTKQQMQDKFQVVKEVLAELEFG